jgi:hypothetical protein
MRQASYILMIVQTVLFSFLLLPLAWMIPMTLAAKKAQTDGQPHIALGLCAIIFALPLGLVAGILLLVE